MMITMKSLLKVKCMEIVKYHINIDGFILLNYKQLKFICDFYLSLGISNFLLKLY